MILIVVSIRELVNTLYSFTLKSQNNQLKLSKCYSINIEIDMPREYSASPSLNSFREMSVNSTTSSIDYADWVQVQANNLTWAKQVENRKV